MTREMGSVLRVKARPEINLTPLIDVLLVLLIMFMVVSPIKPHRFDARVPMVAAAGPDRPLAVLILSLSPKTLELKINNEPVRQTELPQRLSEWLAKQPTDQRLILLKAPKSVPYREVIRVVDLAKEAGAEPISLQIDYLED